MVCSLKDLPLWIKESLVSLDVNEIFKVSGTIYVVKVAQNKYDLRSTIGLNVKPRDLM